MGADYIATGHYARLRREFTISPRPHSSGGEGNLQFPKKQKITQLLTAKDKNKDQTYFLWTLTQDQLQYCIFPIGDYLKSGVRKLAKKFKLPTAEKKDSQGLCFIGKI